MFGKWRTFSCQAGGVTIAFAVSGFVLLAAVGLAVDWGRVTTAKQELQAVVDSATLAAATQKNSSDSTRLKVFTNFLGQNEAIAPYDSSLTQAQGKVTGLAFIDVDTTVLKFLHPSSVKVAAKSVVNLEASQPVEIALVLDVSSSMIEQGRFEPMRKAATEFVNAIMESPVVKAKISIVPFSSRINLGLQNTGMLTSFNGNAAVPDRWKNPASYYNSSYSRLDWIDGSNFAMKTSKNYYWMGCVEPRTDIAAHTVTDIDAENLDESPADKPFVAQDHNLQSGKSFCPPPVLPLSDSKSKLLAAIGALTSQGSTRLDAGFQGGWYTLSPRWSSSWAGGESPQSYSQVKKVVVFMTDGQMNANADPKAKHYDWLCEASSNCNSFAEEKFAAACQNFKSAGTLIFAVAYDKDAEENLLKTCSSGASYYSAASSSSGSAEYILTIYQSIAQKIISSQLYLSE